MTRVLRLPENREGRDFVTGDIHGCFSLVDQGLHQAQFDPEKDRLFVVGDLVDRGPESAHVADFIARPYVYSVRGNHDDVIMNLLGSNDWFYEFDQEQREKYLQDKSMAWIHDLDKTQALTVRKSLESLPYVIEVETLAGPIGFVHADVPAGMSWDEFTDFIEAEDKDTINTAIWSRARALHPEQGGVEGAARIFFGHTPHDQIQQRGNCYFVDTGAVFKNYDSPYKRPLTDPHLTLAQIDLKDHFFRVARPTPAQNTINLLIANDEKDLISPKLLHKSNPSPKADLLAPAL